MHKHINFINYWITKSDPFFLPNPGVLFAFWLLSFLAKQQKQNYPFLPLSYVLLLSKKTEKEKEKLIAIWFIKDNITERLLIFCSLYRTSNWELWTIVLHKKEQNLFGFNNCACKMKCDGHRQTIQALVLRKAFFCCFTPLLTWWRTFIKIQYKTSSP